MQNWIDELIQWLVEFTQFTGYYMLILTIPLSIIQGIISFFPFITILILHVTTFGLMEGILISWVVGSFSSVICFLLFRTIFYETIRRRLDRRLIRYEKWQKYMDDYGLYMVILIRSIPVIPNNVGTFMAAVSPIRFKTYVWATTIGTCIHLWFIGLVSSSILIQEEYILWDWLIFIGICAVIVISFIRQWKKKR